MLRGRITRGSFSGGARGLLIEIGAVLTLILFAAIIALAVTGLS